MFYNNNNNKFKLMPIERYFLKYWYDNILDE